MAAKVCKRVLQITLRVDSLRFNLEPTCFGRSRGLFGRPRGLLRFQGDRKATKEWSLIYFGAFLCDFVRFLHGPGLLNFPDPHGRLLFF